MQALISPFIIKLGLPDPLGYKPIIPQISKLENKNKNKAAYLYSLFLLAKYESKFIIESFFELNALGIEIKKKDNTV